MSLAFVFALALAGSGAAEGDGDAAGEAYGDVEGTDGDEDGGWGEYPEFYISKWQGV